MFMVKAVSGSTRFEKIVAMIEDSEKLKSSMESRAEHLADRLVTVYPGLEPRGLSAFDPECNQSLIRAHGGFFLCIKALYAYCSSVCHERMSGLPDYCEGRKIPGGGSGSGNSSFR